MASDKFLVPVPPRSAEIWGLDAMASLIEEASIANQRLEAYAVINFAFPRGGDNAETANIIREDFENLRLVGTPIIQRKVWSDALGQGLSVLEARPRNRDAIGEFLSLLADLGINRNNMEMIYNGHTTKTEKQFT